MSAHSSNLPDSLDSTPLKHKLLETLMYTVNERADNHHHTINSFISENTSLDVMVLIIVSSRGLMVRFLRPENVTFGRWSHICHPLQKYTSPLSTSLSADTYNM